jgi:hypothetical protein
VQKLFGNLEESTQHDLAALFVTGLAAREAPKNTARQYCTVQYTTADEMKKCRNNQQSCGDGKQYIGLSESMVPLCALVHHVFPN